MDRVDLPVKIITDSLPLRSPCEVIISLYMWPRFPNLQFIFVIGIVGLNGLWKRTDLGSRLTGTN